MSKQYEPELGQALFGSPWGQYNTPLFVDAFLDYILADIDRVFWNVNQRDWDRYENPEIPCIEYRPYYWGEDEKEAIKPNFKFKEVEIRWYKHPGRGQTCNVDWSEKLWRVWLDDCIKKIREYDERMDWLSE